MTMNFIRMTTQFYNKMYRKTKRNIIWDKSYYNKYLINK